MSAKPTIRIACLLLFVCTVLGPAAPCVASVGETELHAIPGRTPDWYYGDGALQLTLRQNAYTSWGSWNSYIDLDCGPNYSADVDQLYLDMSPLVSLTKLLHFYPEKILTDVSLSVHYNAGLINNEFQPIATSWLYGVVFSFGGGVLDALDIHVLYRTFSDYKESYDFAYTQPGWGGFYQIYHYDDVWPYEDSWQFSLEWSKTWRWGKREIFTRGFVKTYKQEFVPLEQYPVDFPGRIYDHPAWLKDGAPTKIIWQPQVGLRFGNSNQYAVGSELEWTRNIYKEPWDDDNPETNYYQFIRDSVHVSVFFALRY